MDKELDVRAYQNSFLCRAFGKNQKLAKSEKIALPPILFLWGPSNSGKTYTLDRCLNNTNIVKININCLEIMCGRSALLETILQQLCKDKENTTKCDTLLSFTHRIAGELQRNKVSTVFIIDQPELLRGDNNDILHFFCYLKEHTDFDVSCIFVSKLPWRCFTHVPDCIQPLQLHFPQYTSEEIFHIITSVPPHGSNPDIYNFYVKMVLDVHYRACRDLKKLWKLVQLRYGDFVSFINSSGHIEEKELHRIWRKIHPMLKEDFERLSSYDIKCHGDVKESSPTDLPLCSILLTIAGYLATVNPVSSDKRFFVKTKIIGGNQKKSENSTPKGLQMVPHSRLIAIFQYISDKSGIHFSIDSSLISNISTLCDIGYLTRYDIEQSLDETKYRCHVSLDIVKQLSEFVSFDLDHYLFSLL